MIIKWVRFLLGHLFVDREGCVIDCLLQQLLLSLVVAAMPRIAKCREIF